MMDSKIQALSECQDFLWKYLIYRSAMSEGVFGLKQNAEEGVMMFCAA